LAVPAGALVVSKATGAEADAYSAFSGTGLADALHEQHCTRIFVGGLATDYCVLATVQDARAAGFAVVLLEDAVRAVDLQPGDGARAIAAMRAAGARLASVTELGGEG
jgi:nicotinamidase/pyrazinamidase